MGKKNVFYAILEQKNDLLRYNNKKFKTSKIEIFPNDLTHAFGQIMTIFQTFFLGNIGQKNVFYNMLEQKNDFLRHNNKKFQKSKN